MKDRFKFRMWNKLSNEMKDVISINYNPDFPECSTVVAETNSFDKVKTHTMPITCANSFNNIILMQCTGLKDKNGELIYEGDIVKAITHNPYEEHIGVIQYHTCYFSLDYKKVGKFEECGISLTKNTSDFVKLEILGNIYENPELLDEDSETCKKRLPKCPLRRVK